ncbi:response regulator transcription factor [Ferrimicrobium acidiphilum]|jgi:two-component system KDP operon response regulator KdpE|uniref:KDP operon transcriptional regulatory protein KdpE n=1 Tax=Ferrimicrobium acidiphilum DSM 19497 TaxID=1121877 RepID=A0A0D8FT27_9ACTN|nr:response regulator transcription factor [Ferrimicrobium acidiphilum]KJE76433.1 KDP operon transcriptional regulatory protein KdpE [Ferrimicrobium acidiphilum DSM 19497]MCL5052770.1 response regulator transcription factor [Gammaproteobacteria bacterium]
MSSILIIDDDPALSRVLRIGLTAAGYDVTVALRGLDGLARAIQDHPDLLVVDLGLPDIDGVSLVTELRRYHTKGIVVLSAAGDEHTKVKALDRGADDYVTKPFGLSEFEARLRALERRMDPGSPVTTQMTAAPGLVIDLAKRVVIDDSRGEIRLTPREFDLLRFLVENHHRLCTHQLLLTTIWGQGYNDPHHVRVYVNRLRSKLGPSGRYLRSRAGMGYLWDSEGDQ